MVFGNELCIGKVIAIYYENNRYHSLLIGPCENLNNLSYITLKIYRPVPGDAFNSIVTEGCMLFSHNNPSNIIYNLNPNSIQEIRNLLIFDEQIKNLYEFCNHKEILHLF